MDEREIEYLKSLLQNPAIGARGVNAIYEQVKKEGRAYNNKTKTGFTLTKIKEWYNTRERAQTHKRDSGYHSFTPETPKQQFQIDLKINFTVLPLYNSANASDSMKCTPFKPLFANTCIPFAIWAASIPLYFFKLPIKSGEITLANTIPIFSPKRNSCLSPKIKEGRTLMKFSKPKALIFCSKSPLVLK